MKHKKLVLKKLVFTRQANLSWQKPDEFISIAKKAKIKRVYTTTNGALASLDRIKSCVAAGLDSIKFSITRAMQKIINLCTDLMTLTKS